MQPPTATGETVVPETLQTGVPVEAKLTGRPEDAVALTVNGPEASARDESVAKLIVWLTFVTVKLRLTAVAAA